MLNTFSLYRLETRNSQGEIMVDLQAMLDRINRVPQVTSEAQQKGLDFEKAVTTGQYEEAFSEYVIEKTRSLLPAKYKTQCYLETRYKDCLIYGYIDLMGNNRGIDLKTTKHYQAPKFAESHQNLYLLGLQHYGIKTLEYIITDFTEVYQEIYTLNQYDFTPLYEEIDAFVAFLQEHKRVIRDKKIWGNSSNNSQLSLF